MIILEVFRLLFVFLFFTGFAVPLTFICTLPFLLYAFLTCSKSPLLFPDIIWKSVWLLWWYCCECYFPFICPQIGNIPADPREITSEYLTHQFRKSGLISENNAVVVYKCEPNKMQGFLSTVFTLTLAYNIPEPNLPRKILIKISARIARVRWQLMMGKITKTEIVFFSKYSHEIPFNHPKYYFSDFSSLSEKYLLAMEYVEHPFVKPSAEYSMPLVEVLKIVTHLARFHSHFEGRQDEFSQFMSTSDRKICLSANLFWNKNIRAFWRNMETLGLEVPKEINEVLDIIQTQSPGKVLSMFACTHQTLSHGDTRTDNIYQLPNGEYGFIDFQMVGNKCNMHDVVFFCLTAAECATILDNRDEICMLYYEEWSKNYKKVHGKNIVEIEEAGKQIDDVLTLLEVKQQFEIQCIEIFIFLIMTSKSQEALFASSYDSNNANSSNQIIKTTSVIFTRLFEYIKLLDALGHLKTMAYNYDSRNDII